MSNASRHTHKWNETIKMFDARSKHDEMLVWRAFMKGLSNICVWVKLYTMYNVYAQQVICRLYCECSGYEIHSPRSMELYFESPCNSGDGSYNRR